MEGIDLQRRKTMNKRILSALLALIMLLGCMPMTALAADVPASGSVSITHVNPIYEGLVDIQPGEPPQRSVVPGTDVPTYTTIKEVGEALRPHMEKRELTVTLGLRQTAQELGSNWGEPSDTDLHNLLVSILQIAAQHTGKPTQGDYIWGNYIECNANFDYGWNSQYYTFTITFSFQYCSTAEQEAIMDIKVPQVLNSLHLSGTDYEKVRAIYDYITQNITYAYDSSGQPDSRPVKHSAYGALEEGSAVCQGYATLLYRMLLTAGIDCRYITGTSSGEGHAWNIVRLGSKYYNVDSTWDSNYKPGYYRYFLLNNANFTNHSRDAEYSTSAFNSAYPMSSTNYVPGGSVAPVRTVRLSGTTYTYSGKVVTPKVYVYGADGTRLTEGVDYTVSYPSGRKNVGKYTITVKGKGNYSFTTRLTFKIYPPKTALTRLTAGSRSFTARWSRKTSQVTGYQLQYSTKSSFASPKTVTISKYSTTSKTVSRLTKGRTYYVRIRTYKTVGSTRYYSGWSRALKVRAK